MDRLLELAVCRVQYRYVIALETKFLHRQSQYPQLLNKPNPPSLSPISESPILGRYWGDDLSSSIPNFQSAYLEKAGNALVTYLVLRVSLIAVDYLPSDGNLLLGVPIPYLFLIAKCIDICNVETGR